MNFHLEFPIQPFSKKLQYKEPLVFIGSCFAENIAVLMKSYKFNTLLNPHGILYNPESIATAIHRYIQNKKLTQQELFYASGAYHSWEHHSRFSNTDAVACISAINEQIETAHATLKEAGWLFITFGSAYAYKLKETGTRVGNCHKQPIRGFEKELLT
ncbi:MAG TPA: GSCFA domain-containing protein, partial [Bacteroidia bacterium]|nr:GSCFA domain-containing protein [Bacteroidia bacterium]